MKKRISNILAEKFNRCTASNHRQSNKPSKKGAFYKCMDAFYYNNHIIYKYDEFKNEDGLTTEIYFYHPTTPTVEKGKQLSEDDINVVWIIRESRKDIPDYFTIAPNFTEDDINKFFDENGFSYYQHAVIFLSENVTLIDQAEENGYVEKSCDVTI